MIQMPSDTYLILWYDAKMKNYVNLIKYLQAKKIVSARISSYLVVDKPE